MKTSLKKLACVFLSILMVMSVVTAAAVSAAEVDNSATGADTVYVDASKIDDNWTYFAWVWGVVPDEWRTMTKNGDYYEVSLMSGENVIFAAMPAGSTNGDWNVKQGQTDNLIYDGNNNMFLLEKGGSQGLTGSWVVYANGTIGTAPKPTYGQNERPTFNTTAPKEEVTVETHPVAEDENEFMYVVASSNLDPKGVKTKTVGNTITVTYKLTADKILDGGQAVITYDSSKLGLSAYNTNATMFPNISGVMSNMNAGIGVAKFNFSGINNDFTQGAVFVNLVFERKYNEVGTAAVNLEVTDLSSKNATYIEDGEIVDANGVTLVAEVTEIEVQEPSEDTTVATDATTDITIKATSNYDDAEVVEIKADKATVKVTFNLKADDYVAYGLGSVTFDENVLALEARYNSMSSIFTTVANGAVYNLNAAAGMMKFAFNGVDPANNRGLYDFTNGAPMVTLVFTVKSGATGTTEVKLNVEELASINAEYVEDSVVGLGSSVTAEGVAEEATTAPVTKPTIETSPNPTSVPTVSTEPTESVTQTEPPTDTEPPTVTEPTTATQKPTKAPSYKLKNSTINAGSRTRVTVYNANGKKITYKSSKTTVAKIDKNGIITGLQRGTTKLTIKVGTKVFYKNLKVKNDPTVKDGKKTLKNKKTIVVRKGQTKKLTITGKASAIKNKVSVKSKKIAKITSNSKQTKVVFKAMKKGKTTLTIKINGVKTYKYTIKVK